MNAIHERDHFSRRAPGFQEGVKGAMQARCTSTVSFVKQYWEQRDKLRRTNVGLVILWVDLGGLGVCFCGSLEVFDNLRYRALRITNVPGGVLMVEPNGT